MALIQDEAQPMTLGDYFQQGQSPASVVGEAASAPLTAPEEQLPANRIGLGAQLAQLQQEQVSALREHAQFAQQTQAQQDQINLRGADLDLGGPILAAPDSRTEKVVRRAILTELSTSVGLDTNGAGNRQRIALLTALSPDTLSDVSQFLSGKLKTIAPGGGVEFTRGFLSGQIPLMPILAEMRTTARQQPPVQQDDEADRRAAFQARFGRPSMLGADEAVQVAQADPAAAVAANRATTQPGEMIPELSVRLGYGPTPLTNREAMARGYRGPTDEAGQRAALTARETAESQRLDLLDRFVAIDALGFGRPEVSPNPPATTPWPFSVTGTFPTAAQIIRFIDNATFRRSGRPDDSALPTETAQHFHDLTGRQQFIVRGGARRLVEEIQPSADAPAAEREVWFREQARVTDAMQGLLGGMRFPLGAVLAGVRPAGLSEAEGDDWMRNVTTSDPTSRRALFAQVSAEFLSETSFLGGPAFDFSRLSPERIERYLASPVLSATPAGQRFQANLQAHVDRQQQQQPPATAATGQRTELAPVPGITVDPAATAPPAGVTTQGQPPPARTQAEINREAAQRLTQEDRAEANRARARAEASDARQAEMHAHTLGTVEARAARHAEIAELELQRRDRGESRAEREKIAAAFRAAAAMIAGGHRGGGGSASAPSLGGDDPNAFRLSPPIQRRAPTPVQARRRARED